METRRLYYEDCALASFTARVLDCTPEGDRYAVILDTTAFYPEGGGQAADVGTLGSARVLDTRERDGQVLHFCDGPLEPGAEVEGRIDYDRRFDLMQQHTGEHIVSGIIHRRFGWHNVGFHVGRDVMQIDFDGPIPEEALTEIELEANGAIWQDLKVECTVPSPEELEKCVYRTKRALPWPVRIVRVPGFDSCACCGVHVARTGQVGIIKLLSCIKFHQGVRIELVCGKRALALLSRVYDENRQVSQAFSAKILETGAAARKMNEALNERNYRIAQLEKQVFRGIAERYVNHGDVLHFEPGLAGGGLRTLAEEISRVCGGIAAVFSGEEGAYSYCLAAENGDLRPLGKAMNGALDGRGGGKPNFQQGTLRAGKGQIEAFFAGW